MAAEPEKTTTPADVVTEWIARSEVLVEQDFAEPVYPVLTPIGAVRNGPLDAPTTRSSRAKTTTRSKR